MIADGSLAIVGGLVLRSAAAEPEPLDILVRDGRIAALNPPGAELPPGLPVLDAARTLIIPGLVNAHYHSHDVLCRGMFEDIPLEVWIALAIPPPTRKPSAREVRLRTLIGAIENLRNGTTTVQDMLGSAPGAEPAVEAALSAYEEAGIRCVMSLQVGNRAAIDCLPGIREVLAEDLHSLISGNPPPVADFLAFVRAPLRAPPRPRLHWAIAPGSPQRCTIELLSGLGDLARSHDLPLVTHVNESKLQVFLTEGLYARFGGSVLDFLDAAGVLDRRLSMAHGIWFSDREIERIATTGAAVATCPASNLKLKNGVAPHRALRSAGVRLSLGCDNVSAGDTENMFEAMRLLAHLNAAKGPAPSGLDARAVFRIATEGGAEVLGLDRDIGSIAVGKRADLTVLDLTDVVYLPLNDAVRQIVYAEGGRAVRDVIVDGRTVVADRKITTVDVAALAADATDLAASFRRDYRDHFDRLAPVVGAIGTVAATAAARPLPWSRWASGGDDRPDDRR